jgi:hypothetical protein
MSTILRIELIVFAVIAIIVVGYTVNRKIIQLKYSLVWIVISLLLIFAACFPKLVFAVTSIVGIETPSNLIFFLAIASLLGICFSLSIVVSKMDKKIKRLTQLISIESREWKGDGNDGNKEN